MKYVSTSKLENEVIPFTPTLEEVNINPRAGDFFSVVLRLLLYTLSFAILTIPQKKKTRSAIVDALFKYP